MKYFILIRIIDWELATSWHNGSTEDTYADMGYETYETAKEKADFYQKKIDEIKTYRSENEKKYIAHMIVLSYQDNDEEKLNDFFKYRTFKNSFVYREHLSESAL